MRRILLATVFISAFTLPAQAESFLDQVNVFGNKTPATRSNDPFASSYTPKAPTKPVVAAPSPVTPYASTTTSPNAVTPPAGMDPATGTAANPFGTPIPATETITSIDPITEPAPIAVTQPQIIERQQAPIVQNQHQQPFASVPEFDAYLPENATPAFIGAEPQAYQPPAAPVQQPFVDQTPIAVQQTPTAVISNTDTGVRQAARFLRQSGTTNSGYSQ